MLLISSFIMLSEISFGLFFGSFLYFFYFIQYLRDAIWQESQNSPEQRILLILIIVAVPLFIFLRTKIKNSSQDEE